MHNISWRIKKSRKCSGRNQGQVRPSGVLACGRLCTLRSAFLHQCVGEGAQVQVQIRENDRFSKWNVDCEMKHTGDKGHKLLSSFVRPRIVLWSRELPPYCWCLELSLVFRNFPCKYIRMQSGCREGGGALGTLCTAVTWMEWILISQLGMYWLVTLNNFLLKALD